MDFCERERSQHRLGLTLAFGTLLFSGTSNALAKGLTPFLSPMTLLILTESLTAFFIIMTFGLVPLLRELKKMDAKSIRMCIIVGLLNSAIAPLLWYTGLARTSAGNASILSSADMVCMLIFGYWLLREPMSRLRLMGAAVVVAGIGIVNVASLQSFSMHAGDLWVLSSAFVFGTGAVLFKKYLSHVMPELAIAIRNVAGITIVFIVSLFFRYSFIDEVMAFPMEKVILLLAFAFFSRYLSLSFFYEALDRLPATTFSLIQIANPLSGLVFAMLILGENIESYQILGGLFIVFGLLLEQCSEHALQSLRSHWLYFHFPLKRRAEMAREIQMLPKHI